MLSPFTQFEIYSIVFGLPQITYVSRFWNNTISLEFLHTLLYFPFYPLDEFFRPDAVAACNLASILKWLFESIRISMFGTPDDIFYHSMFFPCNNPLIYFSAPMYIVEEVTIKANELYNFMQIIITPNFEIPDWYMHDNHNFYLNYELGSTPYIFYVIREIISVLSATNIQLILFLGVTLIILLQLMGTKVLKIKPKYWQVVVENFYNFLLNLIIAQAGHKSLRFFSGIYAIFYFILMFNLLGLLPFGFTVTGHIILTFTLAISFFIAWTIIAFQTLGLSFFRIFLPRNIPQALAPLLVVIEILSFSIRPISLAIRLFANMLAGHILLFIISTAVLVMSSLTIVIGFIPFMFVIIFFILELGIAFLQAYVFTILLAIYLRDALYVH